MHISNIIKTHLPRVKNCNKKNVINIAIENRKLLHCNSGGIGDEFHYIFPCTKFNNLLLMQKFRNRQTQLKLNSNNLSDMNYLCKFIRRLEGWTLLCSYKFYDIFVIHFVNMYCKAHLYLTLCAFCYCIYVICVFHCAIVFWIMKIKIYIQTYHVDFFVYIENKQIQEMTCPFWTKQ